jgi:DNA-binding protein H-NS
MPKTRGRPRKNSMVRQITENLSTLSESELIEMFEELRRKLIGLKEAHETKAREYQALVRTNGFVGKVGRSVRSGTRSKAIRSKNGRTFPPKYKNPANPEETWSGQGRLPRWMPGSPKELSAARLKRFRIGD